MTPFIYIGATIVSCGLMLMGWGGEGYLHKASLILGGLYFGFVLTQAFAGEAE